MTTQPLACSSLPVAVAAPEKQTLAGTHSDVSKCISYHPEPSSLGQSIRLIGLPPPASESIGQQVLTKSLSLESGCTHTHTRRRIFCPLQCSSPQHFWTIDITRQTGAQSATAWVSLQLSAPLTAAKHRPSCEATSITTTRTVDASWCHYSDLQNIGEC